MSEQPQKAADTAKAAAKAKTVQAARRGQGMTGEEAKALGLDPTPYGKPSKS